MAPAAPAQPVAAPPPAAQSLAAQEAVAEQEPAAQPVAAPAPAPTAAPQQFASPGHQAAPAVDPSATLELRGNSDLINQVAPPTKTSGIQFEAVQIGSEDDLLQIQQSGPKRVSHLGFRVTEAYLESFKANIHLIAAINRVPVETVNTVLLNFLASSFTQINEAVAEHKAKSGGRR